VRTGLTKPNFTVRKLTPFAVHDTDTYSKTVAFLVPTVKTLMSAKLHNLLTPNTEFHTDRTNVGSSDNFFSLSLWRLSRHWRLSENFMYRSPTPNLMKTQRTDKSVMLRHQQADGRGLHKQRHSVLPIERLVNIFIFRGIFQRVSSTVTTGRQADHSALQEH